jgi:peptidyl-prolyl cis-trans isomerase C
MKTRLRITAVVITLLLAGTHVARSQAPAAPGAGKELNFKLPTYRRAAPTGWKAVARVNSTLLLERDLVREMYTIFPYAQQHNGFPRQLEPEIRRGALEMIIFDELVFQEAQRRHMTVSATRLAKAEAEFRRQFPTPHAYQQFLMTEVGGSQAAMRQKIRRALLIDQLLKQEVDGPAQVTTAQARARYQQRSAQYKHEELLHIQSISIIPPNPSPAVLREAKQRAEQAVSMAKMARSYRDFGLLAEKLSDDDFHVNMGDHKLLEAGKLPPPIVELARKMKPGDVSGLIQLGKNYTIFRLEARVPAGTTPFAEVEAKLKSDMQKERTQQLRSALSQKLRKNAKIELL